MCSELHNKGCPIEYVEKFMSHLSAEMTYSYVRPKESVQENMEASVRVLQDLVTKEAYPIGVEKGLMERIDLFIKENNYNVEKDLDEICEKLAEHIPIRMKSGGVCIKSSRYRTCRLDSNTDEIYCAYDVCPNIYTFYYMVDNTYKQVNELLTTIDINRKRGCVKQVQKTVNMLHTILNKKLIPQLQELKKVMDEKGVDYVIKKHPQLETIAYRMDEVEMEIDEWKQMIT